MAWLFITIFNKRDRIRSDQSTLLQVEVSNMPPSLLSARAVACGLDKTIYIVCGHGEVSQYLAINISSTLCEIAYYTRFAFDGRTLFFDLTLV